MQSKKYHTEPDFMEAFRSGSETGFSLLFHELFASLCFYALKITGSQAAAEDIAEESLVKVWERRNSFYQYNVLKSYLYTTVRNTSINWSKQQQFHQSVRKEIGLQAAQQETYILEDIIKAETIGQMKTALDTLPEQSLQILKLIFFEGMKIREVAAALGISQRTVKAQKAKALLRLRKDLLPLLLSSAAVAMECFAGQL